MRLLILLSILLVPSADAAWCKGNTHTHTLESDGDTSPEDVVRWYREQGYDFLVITDHDKVTRIDGGGMVLIPGEEITDRFGRKPLHVNALGIEKAIAPQGGESVVEVLQRNIDAVRAQGGIAAVNHPNFGWAFGSEELLALEGATLLEIASGHPYVNVQGPPSVEQMWDDMLSSGKRTWGVAVDDSHHWQRPWGKDVALPGKAWIVVRAAECSAERILASIIAGEFYGSSGVEISDYQVDESGTMTVSIRAKNEARYRTEFIGPKGRILEETRENPAVFALKNVTGYVRARVTDSNGRKAWLQPHFIAPPPSAAVELAAE
jgi:hypothetical protein